MPKTLLEKIVFTIIMAAIMVYGMIVYNVALNTGGVTNATFAMALHEMPIMVPAAFRSWPPGWPSALCGPPTGPSSSPTPSR